MKSSVVALGTCYVDLNAEDYPFGSDGIAAETELLGNDYQTLAGGSAVNFCRLLAALGLPTTFIGMAGTDRMGDLLESLLQENNIRPALIRRADLRTNVSFNMTSAEGRHIMCVAGTASAALAPDNVLQKLVETTKEAGLLYFGGCFKLLTLRPAFPRITELAKNRALTIVVDHGRIPKDTPAVMLTAVKNLVCSADYYLPSREEFCQLWDVPTPEEGLRLLGTKAPHLTVVVKDGANGALYWTHNTLYHIPAAPATRIVDVTGAGDSFNAGVMYALAQARPLAEAVTYGCAVASAKISSQAIPNL